MTTELHLDESTVGSNELFLKDIPKNATVSVSIQQYHPELIFFVANKEVLKFCPNGDVYVKENLATNDKEIIEAVRYFFNWHNETKEMPCVRCESTNTQRIFRCYKCDETWTE